MTARKQKPPAKPPDPRWVPADVLIARLMAMVGDDDPDSKALVRKLRRERPRDRKT